MLNQPIDTRPCCALLDILCKEASSSVHRLQSGSTLTVYAKSKMFFLILTEISHHLLSCRQQQHIQKYGSSLPLFYFPLLYFLSGKALSGIQEMRINRSNEAPDSHEHLTGVLTLPYPKLSKKAFGWTYSLPLPISYMSTLWQLSTLDFSEYTV